MKAIPVHDRVADHLVVDAVLVWIISGAHDDLATLPSFGAGLPVSSGYLFTGTTFPLAPKNVAKQIVSHRVENLVTKVVGDEAVVDEALALGEKLAALPPQALRATKIAMNMHLSRAALGVLDFALAEEYVSFSTPEFKQRVAAFRARSNRR